MGGAHSAERGFQTCPPGAGRLACASARPADLCARPGSLRGRGPCLLASPHQRVHLQSRVRVPACTPGLPARAPPWCPGGWLPSPVASSSLLASSVCGEAPQNGGIQARVVPRLPAAYQAQAGASVLRRELLLPVSVIAAPAAKSLQYCLTLCDPIDGSPPGSPVPWMLQARTLEWVAISFSSS